MTILIILTWLLFIWLAWYTRPRQKTSMVWKDCEGEKQTSSQILQSMKLATSKSEEEISNITRQSTLPPEVIEKLCDGDEAKNPERKVLRRMVLCSLTLVCLLLTGCVTFDAQVDKEINRLESQVTALNNQKETLQKEIDWIDINISSMKQKLQGLHSYVESKPLWEDKKEEEKYTTWYSWCFNKDWVLSWMPDYYENYTYNDACNAFEGYKWCYEWWQFKCLMFKDEQDKINQIWE